MVETSERLAVTFQLKSSRLPMAFGVFFAMPDIELGAILLFSMVSKGHCFYFTDFTMAQ